MKKFLLQYGIYFIIIILSIPSIISLFNEGLPPTHDGEYHVIRFYEFDKVIRSGELFPVWAPDLNYTFGSPLFLYVYPLPNYVSSLLHTFGVSFVDAFKLNLIFATFVGAIGMFLYGRFKFGNWGGVLASVAYTYSPYHLLDIYIRGSVGEVWALALFPTVLVLFDLGVKKKSIAFSLLAGCAFSLVIFSHNILSVMFFFFLFLYALFTFYLNKFSKKILLNITAPIIVGILLSSVFIIPAILEQDYVLGLKVFNVFDHFPEAYQLIIPSWGSGYSGISSGTQMSFQIGVANLLIFFLVCFEALRRKIKNGEKKFVYFFITTFLVSIFLITAYSKFIYQLLPFFHLFQFPWRFLSLAIFSVSILSASLTIFYRSKIFYILILGLIIGSTYTYATASYFHNRTDAYYINQDNFIHGTNSIGNAFQTKWLPQQDALPQGNGFLKALKENVKADNKNPTSHLYTITLTSPDSLILYTAYFPGWEAYVNNKKVDLRNSNGLIEIPLQTGENRVKLFFKNTPVRSVAKAISFITFVLILLILVKKFVTIKS